MAFSYFVKPPMAPLLNCGGGAVNHNRKHISSISLPVRSFSHDFFPWVCAAALKNPGFSDKLLLEPIRAEIQWLEEHDYQPIPEGFPFQIRCNNKESKITLTRKYKGETINVEAKQLDVLDKDISSFPMLVTVSKINGDYLEFEITVHSDDDDDEFIIDICKLKTSDFPEPDPLFGEGLLGVSPNQDLVKAFHLYLKTRGINATTIKVVLQYATANHHREFKEWIYKLKEFVEA